MTISVVFLLRQCIERSYRNKTELKLAHNSTGMVLSVVRVYEPRKIRNCTLDYYAIIIEILIPLFAQTQNAGLIQIFPPEQDRSRASLHNA